MKNILFLANSISFGGAEKMLCFVAESLAKRGYQICIVNLKMANDVTNYERDILDSIKVIKIDNIPAKVEKNIYRIKQICSIVKAEKSDIVIGFGRYPNLYAASVGKLMHIPSIISERIDPTKNPSTSWKDKVKNYIINKSIGGVFQTKEAMSYYGTKLQSSGTVIPNPIFVNGDVQIVPFELRDKTVVSVGRLENEQKRLDVMLGAFKLFSTSHPEYTLRIYGKGSQEEEIKQWCVDLGIQDKVKFMGLTTQPMKDIAKDGMFLITSDYEGISNSLLEAMAVGLPCVSTDHTPGGARLLIQDHVNGILAPIGDVEALAKGLCEFADNRELARSCGEKAQLVTERFKPEKIVDQWENYINLLTEKQYARMGNDDFDASTR